MLLSCCSDAAAAAADVKLRRETGEGWQRIRREEGLMSNVFNMSHINISHMQEAHVSKGQELKKSRGEGRRRKR
jgi:hypothetical protein